MPGRCIYFNLRFNFFNQFIIKFIGATKNGDEIKGFTKIQKITKSMVFLICYLESNSRLIASASGVWKKLNKNISGFGPGG